MLGFFFPKKFHINTLKVSFSDFYIELECEIIISDVPTHQDEAPS